ncbi:hypothetical protein KU6B_20930 [Mameliella alba]|uniref:HamA C-terminal domain-containing protein n=1 Tax=Mameliella alba TaxID=561184 RepID=UPI0013E46A28|nr:DUF1837 domain-containing protein [Mameliella alba]BBU55828.1 hypothetical protein KU6B_20930 [Mameliella alba]
MAVQPKKFLEIVHRVDEGDVIGLAACAGFELGEWRYKKFADHLINWLPHFALKQEEIERIGPENPLDLLRESAYRVFTEEAGKKRGEIGELLLHILCVTEYRAAAFATRVFYKMRSNDQVTGFDSTLVTVDDKTGDIELWLGEAKFYTDTKGAISAALASLRGHLDAGFLEESKILIGPKIEPTAPGYEQLQWLFDGGSKLDEIVKRIVIPVLVASESDAAKSYADGPDKYPDIVIEEFEYVSGRFSDAQAELKVRIVVIYVPLLSKELLEKRFIEKLGVLR